MYWIYRLPHLYRHIANYVYKSMINKRWITLTVVYSRPFASKAVFWAILKEFEFAVDFFWKGSSAGAMFPPKIASLRFQTSQQKGRNIHASPRNFRSKTHPKSPGVSPRRKLKSHSIRAAGMRSKIHTCQPETVPLTASFWLDVVKQ